MPRVEKNKGFQTSKNCNKIHYPPLKKEQSGFLAEASKAMNFFTCLARLAELQLKGIKVKQGDPFNPKSFFETAKKNASKILTLIAML